ncbi:MAG: TonB-dependent receptor, partial [Muribaculaceae bacterium]|nr:TonB-dependent receptor [Muribaculaceae bacterium]
RLHSYYFNSRRGLPGGIVRRLSDLYTDVGREWDSNFFTQITYATDIHGISIKGMVKYANDYLHYRSDYPENIAVHANNRYRQQDIYSAATAAYRYRDFGLSASVDFRWADLVTDVRNYSYVYRIDTKASLAAYYSHKNLSLTANALYTSVTDHTRGNTNPLRRFTWTAMGAYRLSQNLSLRTFYKSVFRAPTLNDLYYTLVGNRNLRPEFTRQLNLGLTWTTNYIDLNCDAYYNRIIDRIVCLPLKGSYQWTMLNYGLTRCLGIDLSATLHLPHSSLLVTATFQDDRNMTDPSDDAYRDFIAYSPRWSLTGVYSLHLGDFYGSLSHMFVDKRYWTAENSIEPPLSPYN